MASTYVRITNGYTRGGQTIENTTFELIESFKRDKDGLYVTVDGAGISGLRAGRNRVYIESEDCVKSVSDAATVETIDKTDAEIARDLSDTFEILGEMTQAVIGGVVRGLVVSGPAGIGKSFTVEKTLVDNFGLFDINDDTKMYEVVSGVMTAAALYEKLWNFRNDGQVLVFDDCDSVLYDEDALNILKAALDTKKTRCISWNSRSRYLEDNDIPNRFEFCGGIIFITNIKFDQLRSARISNHLEAIMSRCHYMDIGVDTAREKVIHIKNTVEKGRMLDEYGFTSGEKKELLGYISNNHGNLRELSLRMVLKIADLKKAMPTNWIKFVEKNCHKRAS